MVAFPELLDKFKHAVETGDVDTFLSIFTEDAIYHDTTYGTFKGHAELKRLLADVFHQEANDFKWEYADPVSDGNIGYAVFRFSVTSSHPNAAQRRALLFGCAQFTLRDGRIAQYKEWGNVAGTLLQAGVPDKVVVRFLQREAGKLLEDPGFAAHLKN